jgi:16S rRNA (cytosine1402-N4)-methyltransferase
MKHITVLRKEAIELLSLNASSKVVDATYGAGGHAELICEQLGENGTYVGIDADKEAFKESSKLNRKNGPVIHLINDNFANLEGILSSLNIEKVDAILADLGWRTDQFTDGGKGFSFDKDEPLLMTYGDPELYTFTAEEIVNTWDEENIADIIYAYGEERYSRRIAKAIVEAREIKKISSAKELAEIVESAVPIFYKKRRINPATKTFQALRIAVNDELSKLETFITSAMASLKEGGVLAIITFHSLEDRIVKLRFKEHQANYGYQILTKKPICASDEELQANPRARSAKLRAIRKVS